MKGKIIKCSECGIKIQKIIDTKDYEGVRDQDGWETLELTVRDEFPKTADRILGRLADLQNKFIL